LGIISGSCGGGLAEREGAIQMVFEQVSFVEKLEANASFFKNLKERS
jgi:hypothetical protein